MPKKYVWFLLLRHCRKVKHGRSITLHLYRFFVSLFSCCNFKFHADVVIPNDESLEADSNENHQVHLPINPTPHHWQLGFPIMDSVFVRQVR